MNHRVKPRKLLTESEFSYIDKKLPFSGLSIWMYAEPPSSVVGRAS